MATNQFNGNSAHFVSENGSFVENYLDFKAGDVIFRQGDFPKCMYDIRTGHVAIYAEYGTAAQRLLTTFGPGQMFGEMEIIASCPRAATAVAADDVKAVPLTQSDFTHYFQDKPEKVLAVMRQLSRRVKETTDVYLDACRTVYETVQSDRSGGEKSAHIHEKLSLLHRIGRALGR